jgi:hypothetical protein
LADDPSFEPVPRCSEGPDGVAARIYALAKALQRALELRRTKLVALLLDVSKGASAGLEPAQREVLARINIVKLFWLPDRIGILANPAVGARSLAGSIMRAGSSDKKSARSGDKRPSSLTKVVPLGHTDDNVLAEESRVALLNQTMEQDNIAQ